MWVRPATACGPETASCDAPSGRPKRLGRRPVSAGNSVPLSPRPVYVNRPRPRYGRNTDAPVRHHAEGATAALLCFRREDRERREVTRYDWHLPHQLPRRPRATPTVRRAGRCTRSARWSTCTAWTPKPGMCCGRRTSRRTTARRFRRGASAATRSRTITCLICTPGAERVAVAFDAETGAEKWKASTPRDLGYSPPTLIRAGGVDSGVDLARAGDQRPGTHSPQGPRTVGLEPLYGHVDHGPAQAGRPLFAVRIGVRRGGAEAGTR